MISNYNSEKYKDKLSNKNEMKKIKQNKIKNVLSGQFLNQNVKMNENDYYDFLQKENLIKLELLEKTKEKNLKTNILDLQDIRENFEQSKIKL